MKSLTLLLQYVLIDLGTWCGTSTTRDLKTIMSRVEHEGLSFLTITLADFGKDFQKSLDQGHVGHDQFLGFSRTGGLPRLLGGFLDRVFERSSGRLLDEPDITAIWAIRQLTLMWAKMKLTCSDARIREAMSRYIQCEKDVRISDANLSPSRREDFKRIGRLLWVSTFTKVDSDIYYGEILPKHGPGATADKLTGNRKWSQKVWTERLEDVFPAGEYLVPNQRYSAECLSDVTFLEPGAELPVKVVAVPKTLKTPRIIAVEPTCMQYMQQGILRSLSEAISADDIAAGFISTEDQEPNQLLAQQGSSDGTLATLDLSEASDRVSNQHVRDLLANHPWLAKGVDACRSRKADVLGYGVQRLAKFASMGSALCFPFEAMVFLTIIFVAIEKELKRPLTKKDLRSFLGKVRVYGDDIIVPVEFVPSVLVELEAFGFLVNTSKSFWNGKFRESCGRDFYAGVDISIVRVRQNIPTRPKHVTELVSAVSLRNQLYKAGLWRSARYLDNTIRGLIPFPNVAPSSPLLGRFSFLGVETDGYWDKKLHRLLVKGHVAFGTSPPSQLDGYSALLKCLTIDTSDLPVANVRHLERAGRSRAVYTKPRRGPVV